MSFLSINDFLYENNEVDKSAAHEHEKQEKVMSGGQGGALSSNKSSTFEEIKGYFANSWNHLVHDFQHLPEWFKSVTLFSDVQKPQFFELKCKEKEDLANKVSSKAAASIMFDSLKAELTDIENVLHRMDKLGSGEHLEFEGDSGGDKANYYLGQDHVQFDSVIKANSNKVKTMYIPAIKKAMDICSQKMKTLKEQTSYLTINDFLRG